MYLILPKQGPAPSRFLSDTKREGENHPPVKGSEKMIAPNTNIRILSDVPLNSLYKNTLYFDNLSNQLSYFIGKTKYNLEEQSYQRVNNGVCRIGIKNDDLYNCNYMMFQNSNFGNKWFFAFINSSEYISNTVSEIHFEIDVIQSWFFDFTLQRCFIEREHSITDEIGDNIVGEEINVGNIVANDLISTDFFDSYLALISTSYDPDGDAGGYQGGLFSGLSYVAAPINTPEGVAKLKDFLKKATEANKADSIVSIVVIPSDFYTTAETPSVQVQTIDKPTDLNGYTPKNNKLFTYPYCYLACDCGNNAAIYRYELFDSDNCQFSLNGCVTTNPQIQLVPVNYNGAEFNYIEKLIMEGFPQIGYSIDSYRAWVAQNSTSTAISATTAALGVTASLATGNPIAAAMSISAAANVVNQVAVAETRPPQARGSNGGTIEVATRTKNFWFRHMSVTAQYAKIIDDYFTVYGYAQNIVKIPNINARPEWNYTKTRDCIITGSIPGEDSRKICEIFNAGITFWKNPDNIGQYQLTNKN